MGPLPIGVLEIDADAARLLVAEADAGTLVPLLSRRTAHEHGVFPGRSDIDAVVSSLALEAREHGAEAFAVCASQALAGTPDERSLRSACRRADVGVPRILSPGQRADLAFLGATATSGDAIDGTVAVIDLGGNSTKIAFGDPGEAPSWRGSRAVASGRLNERALLSDPPTPDQLGAARNAVGRRLLRLEPPAADATLVAATGSALELVCGPALGRDVIGDMLNRLLFMGTGGLAVELGVDAVLLRSLPAELLVLEALCDFVPEPLTLASGGVLEGLALLVAEEPAVAGHG